MMARSELRFSSLLEAERFEIVGHGRAVGEHAAHLGQGLRLSETIQVRLRLAGLLHDIGKVEIPASILGRPGPLDAREWAQVRRHPAVGAKMLRDDGLNDIAPWVRSHHERFDGGGYPDGFAGSEIPIEGRVLAVADAYDAMVSERPYSAALDPAEACEELRRGAGTQFDPTVVMVFLHTVEPEAASVRAGTVRRFSDSSRW